MRVHMRALMFATKNGLSEAKYKILTSEMNQIVLTQIEVDGY